MPQIEYRPAKSREEVAAALQVLRAAFPQTLPQYFELHQWRDPTLQTQHTRLALVDGHIASVVQIFPRTMMVRGQQAKLAGIGNVGTHPDRRGLGISSELMRRTLEEMAAQQFLLSMLFTKIPRYFSQFGYLPVCRNEYLLRCPQEIHHSHIRLFSPERHLEGVMVLYENFSASRTGTLTREAGYWRGQLEFAEEDKDGFILLADSDRINAYVRTKRIGTELRIVEHGYRHEFSEALVLASSVGAAVNAETLRFSLTADELAQSPHFTPCVAAGEDEIMIMPLVPEALAELFSLDDVALAAVVANLFGGKRFTYWQTDFF